MLLIVVFRNIRVGLLSFVPNFIPAIMGFGLWGYFVGRVNIASSVVVAIVFGIVVDDTIHFLSKYQEGRRAGLGPEEAVRLAFKHCGPCPCDHNGRSRSGIPGIRDFRI